VDREGQDNALYVNDTFKEFIAAYNQEVMYESDIEEHLVYMIGIGEILTKYSITIKQLVHIIVKKGLNIDEIGDLDFLSDFVNGVVPDYEYKA